MLVIDGLTENVAVKLRSEGQEGAGPVIIAEKALQAENSKYS